MSIEAMKQALDALEIGYECVNDEAVETYASVGYKTAIYEDVKKIADAITTLRAAIEQAEEPLIDSVRQMRDVQGMDGTWNCDPYMHGLYNGLEFAVSLLEQREPQFKDAPEKWLSDLPKPRIFSATEAAHGIGEKK
jgi:hypothetical protein